MASRNNGNWGGAAAAVIAIGGLFGGGLLLLNAFSAKDKEIARKADEAERERAAKQAACELLNNERAKNAKLEAENKDLKAASKPVET